MRYFGDVDIQTHPIPNSSQFAFPTISAPLSDNSATAVASNGDVKLPNIFEEHVVGSDLVQMLSLTANRRPVNGPLPDDGQVEVVATSALTVEAIVCKPDVR